jgi:hypothetical protein
MRFGIVIRLVDGYYRSRESRRGSTILMEVTEDCRLRLYEIYKAYEKGPSTACCARGRPQDPSHAHQDRMSFSIAPPHCIYEAV